MSPDPLGYVDSANLYSFAGGDPINRRDPTGEDAYDDKYQAYVRWYGAQADAMWQRRKAIGAEIRRRGGRDVGTLEAEENILATRMLLFGGISENALTYFEAARARGDVGVLERSFEQIHADVLSDESVRNVGAAVIGAFMPHAPRTVRQKVKTAPRAVASASEINLVRPRPQVSIENVSGAVINGQRVYKIPPGSSGGETAYKKIAPIDRQRFFEKGTPLCSYCRTEDALPVDHVKARSRGGNRDPENLTPACEHCNPSKGARVAPKTPPPGFKGDWPPRWWPNWMREWWDQTYGN